MGLMYLYKTHGVGVVGEKPCILGSHVTSQSLISSPVKWGNIYTSNSLWWSNEITFENAFHIKGARINVIEISCKREEGKEGKEEGGEERRTGKSRPGCVSGAQWARGRVVSEEVGKVSQGCEATVGVYILFSVEWETPERLQDGGWCELTDVFKSYSGY